MGAQAGGELEAVDATQAQIEEDDRRPRTDGQLEPVLAGVRHEHPGVGEQRGEVLPEHLACLGVVLDDEDYAHRPQVYCYAVEANGSCFNQHGWRPVRRKDAITRAGCPQSLQPTSFTRMASSRSGTRARTRAPKLRGVRSAYTFSATAASSAVPSARRSGANETSTSGTAVFTQSRNALAQPTMTKLFHRQRRSKRKRASGADGFSQKRRTSTTSGT